MENKIVIGGRWRKGTEWKRYWEGRWEGHDQEWGETGERSRRSKARKMNGNLQLVRMEGSGASVVGLA